jgi:ribose transport system permease protein
MMPAASTRVRSDSVQIGPNSPDPDVAAPIPVSGPKRNRWRNAIPDELGVIVAFVVLVGLVGALNSTFLGPANLLNLAAANAIPALLACAVVFMLAMREIDLSFGWILNLSAVIAGNAMIAGFPVPLAIVAGLLTGAFLGMINGVLSVWFRIPLIIITLGTAPAYQGLALVLNGTGSVVPPASAQASPWFKLLGGSYAIPPIVIVLLVVAVALHFLLKRTRFGYRVLAIGSNPDAARLAGIPTTLTKIQATSLMGLLSGLGGVLFLGFQGAVDTTTGSDYLLTVIAAAIIGGTALSGGSGTIFGSLLGAMVLAVIGSGIIFLGINAVWSTFVTGAVILTAIGIDQVVRRRRARQAEHS